VLLDECCRLLATVREKFLIPACHTPSASSSRATHLHRSAYYYGRVDPIDARRGGPLVVLFSPPRRIPKLQRTSRKVEMTRIYWLFSGYLTRSRVQLSLSRYVLRVCFEAIEGRSGTCPANPRLHSIVVRVSHLHNSSRLSHSLTTRLLVQKNYKLLVEVSFLSSSSHTRPTSQNSVL
jgi:hypothetical protein